MKITDSRVHTLGLAVVVLAIMTLGPELPTSNLSWWIALPAWLIILITAAARLYDIKANSKRWFVRRLGLILVAGGTGAFVLADANPTWLLVSLSWGVALVYLTTPGMPPWHKYISGEWRQTEAVDGLPPASDENTGNP